MYYFKIVKILYSTPVGFTIVKILEEVKGEIAQLVEVPIADKRGFKNRKIYLNFREYLNCAKK